MKNSSPHTQQSADTLYDCTCVVGGRSCLLRKETVLCTNCANLVEARRLIKLQKNRIYAKKRREELKAIVAHAHKIITHHEDDKMAGYSFIRWDTGPIEEFNLTSWSLDDPASRVILHSSEKDGFEVHISPDTLLEIFGQLFKTRFTAGE